MTGPKVSKKRWFGLPPKRVPCLLTMVFDICRNDRVLWSFMYMTPQTMRERSWSERDQKASVKPKTCRKNNKSCQPLNICQMTFIYYYIYHRYHHRINLYIIRSFCKKTHESAFGLLCSSTLSKTKKSMVFARGSGGAPAPQSLTPIPAPRTVRRPHRPPGSGFWRWQKWGKDMIYVFFVGDLRWFLMIWDDFRIFEVISSYFWGVGHLWRTPCCLFVCLSLPKTRLVLQVDLDWFGWVFWNSWANFQVL